MFALQSIVQQQGSHQQIFLPPRAPHQQHMQKVNNSFGFYIPAEIYDRKFNYLSKIAHSYSIYKVVLRQ